MSGLANDPPIIPIGVILHVRAGLGDSLFDYFNGPSGGIESHMYLTFDGKWEQYRDTTREGDANLHGNSFVIDGKRYGFISVETEGLDNGTWTDVQLAEIKAFLSWASAEHGFPLRVCPAWNKAGVGYHTMFGAPGPWTPVAKDCPGPNRIKQFNAVLVPWMKNPTQTDWFDMADISDLQKAVSGLLVTDVGRSGVTVGVMLERIYNALAAPDALAQRVADKVALAQPGVDSDLIKNSVKEAMREGTQ